MENENKADEKPVENSQEGVNNVENAPVDEEMVTLPKSKVSELIETAEQATTLAAKKASDAENYQKGMMKYKSMLKDNGIDDEDERTEALSEERIAKIVADEIAKVVPVITPKSDDELEKANLKIEEMRVALANSGRPASSSAGSNVEKENQPTKSEAEKFFSEEQKAEIKKKFPNISIEEVYKNLQKNDGQNGNV